jgi:hypothetical protein
MSHLWKCIIFCAALIFNAGISGQSAEDYDIPIVPDNVSPANKQSLNEMYNSLISQLQELRRETEEFNTECADKKISTSETDLIARCYAMKAKLAKDDAKLINDIKSYKKNLSVYNLTEWLNNPSKRVLPLKGYLTNNEENRDAYEYSKIINQFRVDSSKRYAVSKGLDKDTTYCNIFVWDVTRAMGAEIPHWIQIRDPKESSAVDNNGDFIGDANSRDELNVNKTMDWLKKNGKTYGWKHITSIEAQRIANEGHPTVAIWSNPKGGHGHIAMVRPGLDEDPRGEAIAQAGALVVNANHIQKGFNLKKLPKVIDYWYHE